MKAVELGLGNCVASLVWTRKSLESRKKKGGLSWLEGQNIDTAMVALERAMEDLVAQRSLLKGIADVKGVVPGGFINLSTRGKREYRPCLGEEVDADLLVISLDPVLVESPSGIRCYLTRTQIEVE